MRTSVISVSLLLLCFVSCGRPAAPHDRVRPVKVTVAQGAGTLDKDFAGMATSDDVVNLAFRVSGQVLDIPLSSGQEIRKGQLLAELDPRDFELQVDADRTAFAEASSQLSRMKRLLEHEAVSQQEYEATQTRYAQAKSTYENAKDVLKDAKLLAPFSAVVESVAVEKYERVQSGQTIVRIASPYTSTVKFTMPESALQILSQPATRFTVEFDNYRSVRFEARLKQYVKTSSDASGFPVSLTLEGIDTDRYKISPGMSCIITVRSSDPIAGAVSVPLTAIYAPAGGGEYAWVVKPDSMVEQRAVKLGEVYGSDRIIIDSGLHAGQTVVTAGVYQLRDGQRVRILK